MKIGIIADTHDNLPNIEKAVIFFNKERVDYVLHAGDYVAPFSVKKLNGLSCDFCGVFGNNDGEKKGLNQVSEGKIKNGPLRITLEGRCIVIVHDINSINPAEENAHLIVFGHSHTPEVSERESCLLVNPGECSGWLSGCSSVAVVDLIKLSPKIFYL